MKLGGVLLRVPQAAAVFVLTCVFALRLLTPAGFMPAFDHGRLTIVSCPDAFEAQAAIRGHHNHPGAPKKVHQPCPYAAAPALGLPVADLPTLAALLTVGLALLLGRAFRLLGQHRAHDRPPPRGPPLPA